MSMSDAARAMGKRGGAARAKSLTPERRREIAMMGVAARRGKVEVDVVVYEAASKLGLTRQQFADYMNSREWDKEDASESRKQIARKAAKARWGKA